MTETLRPSTLGEILDRTAQLYRSNFWLFAGTAAMPLVLAFCWPFLRWHFCDSGIIGRRQ